ncbi:beta-N-acetylhexosaminidase [Sphingomonas koreensis]|jgi:beta-N-acetylhexosaminidase|uniref:beta-N-acetylhexosaminidase n=1 Tax=Sphingomonas koreensis TaxID=93064 RepID=A0A1L6JE87_9SPHN|nr:beta-N-acetylhexosaminidase [Sphingomonas koreensis]APR54234.1 beta-hexosaminidase [Sphingomonas koreensis]MDC7809244.1 beta-N-acetylhexosaminidase [Sphingomonas koreensis]RSU18557.1 beta-N-acetylhexosaminidase [Sphingomonas koreensis]RSU22393.1 beta-N-acetylhexosaminidase [Sphingomonas koreensis]RSU23999.1 beta-N-acetylhexosaminidase [Sphingomonas koreensis]
MKPVIFGLSGTEITAEERAFFRDADPLGYILFKRNCETRAQMLALTDSLRDLSGRADVPILIDQEGGRVARMQPPEWPAFPAGPVFDRLYDLAPSSAIEAARANGQALALMLAEVGINVNCAPLLDVRQPETTPAVAERTFGSDPMQVAALGRAMLDGMARGGVVGVVKHMPGHGRGVVDSHYELPVVKATDAELERDIEPFRTLSGAPMGMTCHVVFEAWDAERPATLSPTVIADVIRGRIGFDGLLMTDDIDMKALSGTAGEKAAAAIAAGCDVALDCWARMGEMVEIAGRLGDASAATLARLERAMASIRPEEAPMDALIAKRDELLALA